MQKNKRRVVVIGAGPAGLTAAYELLNQSEEFDVVVLEENEVVGGISKTVNYKGNRMDMGGHRFFSKSREVNEWWEKMLPMQGKPAIDDKKLKRECELRKGGPDPEKDDEVMLTRKRVSRIFFERKFYDYPISLSMKTIRNMGFLETISVGGSYIKSAIHKRKEESLEDFYINRFGKKLYKMFFEKYTESLWGKHPRDIAPEWGAQRVKGLSIMAILKDIGGKAFKGKNRKVETSLIEEFKYPKFGPGQLWEKVAKEVGEKGGEIVCGAKVVGLKKGEGDQVTEVVYEKNGKRKVVKGDVFVSTMPIRELVGGMNSVPEDIKKIAEGLPYRDYMTVGILTKGMTLKNETSTKTMMGIVPDEWIYVHEKDVKMGRIQIFNNWSPYLVKNNEKEVWMGVEYFCNEGDDLWSMDDNDFKKMAVRELAKIGVIKSEKDVLDYHVERVKRAYPAYFGTYDQIDKLRKWLDKIPNLFLIGRNGQHRYNNMDHSMMTAFEAVKSIKEGLTEKDNIWAVNTEEEYNEAKVGE